MKNQIIDYKILNIKVTDKTNWLFIKLTDASVPILNDDFHHIAKHSVCITRLK